MTSTQEKCFPSFDVREISNFYFNSECYAMESGIWKNMDLNKFKCSFNTSFNTSSQVSFTSCFNPHIWSRVFLAINLYLYYLEEKIN